jgi:hypothetical protein
VTNEAVDFVNGEVRSLDELCVTGGASKLHPPSQLTQMLSVRESNILIDHVFLKIFNLMASLLKTTRIADLGMRPARCFSRDEIGQRDLTIHPFALQMIEKARLIVAFRTCHMSVTGSPPRFHIGIHLVTKAAESGTFGKSEKGS